MVQSKRKGVCIYVSPFAFSLYTHQLRVIYFFPQREMCLNDKNSGLYIEKLGSGTAITSDLLHDLGFIS